MFPALAIPSSLRGLLCPFDTFSSLGAFVFYFVLEKGIRNQDLGIGVLTANGLSLPADPSSLQRKEIREYTDS